MPADPTFDAFVSYSHAADHELAPAVRRGLQRLAKPWYQRRAMSVFLDRSGLEVTPELWSTIARALDSSTYLVLMASPQAAASEWVNREIRHWLAHRSVTHILPVLTSGEWVWDPTSQDLDRERSTAAPPALHGAFGEEPGYLDLRWATRADQLDLRHPPFRDAIAQLAAPIRGQAKSELDGEDLRQHRRTRGVAWSAVAALLVLLIAATGSAVAAVHSAAGERTERDLAVSRQLAAEATTRLTDDPQLATLLSLAAAQTARTEESDSGLLRAVAHDEQVEGFLASAGGPSRAAAFSHDKKTLATGAADGPVRLWDVATRTVVREVPAPGAIGLAFVGDMTADDTALVTMRDDAGVQLWDAATGRHRADLGPAATTISPAGRYVVAGYLDGHLQIWDAATGTAAGSLSPGLKGLSASIELLGAAAAVLAQVPAPLERARALVDFGATLRRPNPRAEARDIAQVLSSRPRPSRTTWAMPTANSAWPVAANFRRARQAARRGTVAWQKRRSFGCRSGPGRGRNLGVWLVWLVLAVVLGVAEMLTLTAVLGILGAAALITSIAATVGIPVPIQLGVFAVTAVVGVVLIRPVVRRHLERPSIHVFGPAAHAGKTARVIHEIHGDNGRVRIGGEDWTARTYDEALVIPVGTVVDVLEINGVIALVYPKE